MACQQKFKPQHLMLTANPEKNPFLFSISETVCYFIFVRHFLLNGWLVWTWKELSTGWPREVIWIQMERRRLLQLMLKRNENGGRHRRRCVQDNGSHPASRSSVLECSFFLVHTAIGHSFVVHLSCQPLRAMDTGIIPPIPWLHEGDQTLGAIDQRGPSTLSPSGHWQPYFYPSTPLRTHFRGMAFGPRDTLVFASFLFFPFFFFEQEDLADVFFFWC